MGSARKQNKSFRTRATRSSGRSNLLTSDPLQNTVQLNNQLRSLGLYAAPTIGDGNCLFRALSDQHYGSPSRHVEVRREICDFIEAHPERYEGFVDVDEFGESGVRKEKGSGLSAYVAGMRQNATYGGHMELSAFAHLTKRNIKVVQPGLVYVIQCDPAQPKSPKPASKKAGDSPSKYTRSGSSRELDGDGDSPMSPGEGQDSTIYVAYHDWEHFSSVRNLRGPHTGIPQVCEMAPPPSAGSSSSASPPPEERLPPSKARKKERERKEKEKKEAGRLKAKEKATPHTAHGSVDKPKSRVMDSQASASSSTQQTTGFKLKIPPRSLPTPPTLYMTAATPISAGASPLSSLPPSPIEESDGFLDATTIPLPISVSPSVATTPPVSNSPSPAPVSSSEQPTSDSEDASMGSPTVDLSATITLPKSNLSTTTSHASSDSSVYPTHMYSFTSHPYAYAAYPTHLTQVTPAVTSASYHSSVVTGRPESSPSTSNSMSQPSQPLQISSQVNGASRPTSESSIGSSTVSPSTPVYFSTNPSAVAIDPLSNLSHLTHLIPPPRIQRSPKRSFEESVSEEGSAESGISTSSAESKRSRIEDEDASEYRGRQGHRNEQMEDSPEPVENGVLPSLKEDEPESTDADDGHHSKADGLMGKSQDSLPDAPASMLSARGSESPHESNDEDDDDDDEYVDEEDANNDDDDDDEDYLEPHVRSVVPPKMARNRHVGTMSERPLTRRQRKKLGLPKPRNIPVSGKGVGKIVIPGGKSTNSLSRDTSSTAEWTANGNGRVDVRGFRELKI